MKIAALLLAAVPSALAFTAPLRASPMRAASRSTMKMATGSVFENAVNDFKESFPAFYAKGWGPTTKAERWNGRHAMFGWFAMVFTGYAQAHNLIPDFDTPLDLKEWGTLATLYGTQTITNGRAIILIAHVHALMMSVCAAIAPLSYQDKLFLEDGEADEPAAGLVPAMDTGLTKSAELWNGRVAMLGLVALVVTSVWSETPVLDVINVWLGGLLLKA